MSNTSLEDKLNYFKNESGEEELEVDSYEGIVTNSGIFSETMPIAYSEKDELYIIVEGWTQVAVYEYKANSSSK